MSTREIYEIACDAVRVAPPRWRLPIRLLTAASYPAAWIARLRRRDTQLTPVNVRLMHIMTPLDHSKAVRELGWQPASTPDAIARAARFFQGNRRNAGVEEKQKPQ